MTPPSAASTTSRDAVADRATSQADLLNRLIPALCRYSTARARRAKDGRHYGREDQGFQISSSASAAPALSQIAGDVLGSGGASAARCGSTVFIAKELFGVPPSGRHVWWTGMPIFTFQGTKVRDLFVLGDIHGLISRLKD